MGKSQKKRNMRRHNPMRVPDSHLPKGLASASASSSKSEAILPIMQKVSSRLQAEAYFTHVGFMQLESLDPTERKWACVAVSNLIHNDPSTRRLLQGKNIVGALITRLSDSEEEVVVEAAGSLRCVLPRCRDSCVISRMSGIYVSTAVSIFARRCSTRISLHH